MCNTFSLQPVSQPKIVLQVAGEVEQTSSFLTTLRETLVAVCNMHYATCLVMLSLSLRCKLQQELPRVTASKDDKKRA